MPSSSQPLNECSAKRFLQTSWKVTEQPGKTTRIRQRRQRILRLETTRQLIITYYLLYTLRFTSTLYVCAVDSCIAADIIITSEYTAYNALPPPHSPPSISCACLVSYRMRAFRFLIYYNSNNYLLLGTVLTTRIMTLILPKSHRALLRECLNIYKVAYLHKFRLA